MPTLLQEEDSGIEGGAGVRVRVRSVVVGA